MKTKELKTQRSKSQKELRKLVVKKKIKLTEEFANLKAGGKKSPKKARQLKSDIAQILTIIREKQLVEQITKDKEQSIKEGDKVK